MSSVINMKVINTKDLENYESWEEYRGIGKKAF